MEPTTSPPPPTRPARPRPGKRAKKKPLISPTFWVLFALALGFGGGWALRPHALASDPEVVIHATPLPRVLPTQPASPRTLHALTVVKGIVQAPPTFVELSIVGYPVISAAAGGAASEVPQSYTVGPGDSLSAIAVRFGVTTEELMALNGLSNPDMLPLGKTLVLPHSAVVEAPYQRLMPDSEVVLSPAYKDFDLRAFVEEADGFLASYREEVEGDSLSGAEVVERVAVRYSVGPRVLLAVLEYESGWVTQKEPAEQARPIHAPASVKPGLFHQLSWAAHRLNEGFYGKITGRHVGLFFNEGTHALFHHDITPATAALQNLYAANRAPDQWARDLSEEGVYKTYEKFFGNPWQYTVGPVVPEDLTQPPLRLPWFSAETWYYTGGPHGGWGDTSGWAALDFVPSDRTGCSPSSFWTLAAADGKIIRSERGEVVLDLDGDGFVGTGWTLLYLHMSTVGRVPVGTVVKAGDPIGHPSCEGGFSTAAHLHIARRYNGQWIEADGPVPFVIDGWQATSTRKVYNGYLIRGEKSLQACACREKGLNDISPEAP